MNDFRFYFRIGWEHIINKTAVDHIFFVAALAAIYMLKDWKQVFILVTAFTVGHVITLLLSVSHLIEINSDLVEFLIPCTIIITAVSNLFLKTYTPRSIRINYFLALFFGLIHGLAFASTLTFLLASDQRFSTAWISFSLGLELGQILVVLVILLAAQLVISVLKMNRRYWVMLISIVVLGLALKMLIERWPAREKKRAGSELNGSMKILKQYKSELFINKSIVT